MTKKPLTIVLTGGGTGGHITPILAVAHELKQQQPAINIVYIGERHGKFAELTNDNPDIDQVYSIFAGKFRRYHGESWLKRLLDIKTNLQNIRDAFYVVVGIFQSWRLLGKIKPNAVFQKGGFVGMPVGIAAGRRKIPLITHDSDAVPGLANRVVSRWAMINATGMPAEYYSYSKEKIRHVGVLLAKQFRPVTTEMQKGYRAELGLPADAQVIFITGASQGARSINLAMVKLAPQLLDNHQNLYILHQVGKGNARVYGDYTHPRLKVEEFVRDLYRYSGAADVVVTRGSATNLAEFGVQGRGCVVIAHPLLTGGHQVKNVEYLLQQEAVLAVKEANDAIQQPELLLQAIETLLTDKKQREALGAKLQAITPRNATQELVKLLLEAAA